MHVTTSTPAAAMLEQLEAEGFLSGKPPHVAEEMLALDRRVYSRMACPECGRRSLQLHPFRQGRQYRCLAVCPCGAAEEV